MYLEHSRGQQSVYKGSLPSHSDSFCEGPWLETESCVPKVLRRFLGSERGCLTEGQVLIQRSSLSLSTRRVHRETGAERQSSAMVTKM
jgi:hypothetical protein